MGYGMAQNWQQGAAQYPPPPLCDIPSGCCSFTGPAEQRVGASAKRHRDPCYPSHGREAFPDGLYTTPSFFCATSCKVVLR